MAVMLLRSENRHSQSLGELLDDADAAMDRFIEESIESTILLMPRFKTKMKTA
jgi:hypothetical protein